MNCSIPLPERTSKVTLFLRTIHPNESDSWKHDERADKCDLGCLTRLISCLYGVIELIWLYIQRLTRCELLDLV